MRRLMTALTFAVLTAGCAAMTASSHVELTANFGDYQTYDWGEQDTVPVGDPRLDNNPFFRDYVMGAIEKGLAAKGYERAVEGRPDLLIHYHAAISHKLDIHAAPQRYGECYGDCEPRVVSYEQGTLVVDVVDRETGKVVWRGWAQDAVDGVIDDQVRLRKHVNESIKALMLRFPNGGTDVP